MKNSNKKNLDNHLDDTLTYRPQGLNGSKIDA